MKDSKEETPDQGQVKPLRELGAEAMRQKREKMGVPPDTSVAEMDRLARIRSFNEALINVIGPDREIKISEQDGRLIAIVEGLRFVQGSHIGVNLLGECPRCGRETESLGVYNYETLGKMLEEFKPNFLSHHCRANKLFSELKDERKTSDTEVGSPSNDSTLIVKSAEEVFEALADYLELRGRGEGHEGMDGNVAKAQERAKEALDSYLKARVREIISNSEV